MSWRNTYGEGGGGSFAAGLQLFSLLLSWYPFHKFSLWISVLLYSNNVTRAWKCFLHSSIYSFSSLALKFTPAYCEKRPSKVFYKNVHAAANCPTMQLSYAYGWGTLRILMTGGILFWQKCRATTCYFSKNGQFLKLLF